MLNMNINNEPNRLNTKPEITMITIKFKNGLSRFKRWICSFLLEITM
jgi:hypothetical protein